MEKRHLIAQPESNLRMEWPIFSSTVLLFTLMPDAVRVTGNVVDVIYLHCSKYPHAQVFGVLLGSESDAKQISCAVPLFHGPFLAPMFESAMRLVRGPSTTSPGARNSWHYINIM